MNKQLEQKIEQRLTKLAGDLNAKQAAYKAQHGRFWQGLRTLDTAPKDGETKKHDVKRKPSDQAEAWEDFGINLPDSECSFQVDTYDGPNGQGYCITADAVFGDEVWRRTINVGPESYRERGWEKIGG